MCAAQRIACDPNRPCLPLAPFPIPCFAATLITRKRHGPSGRLLEGKIKRECLHKNGAGMFMSSLSSPQRPPKAPMAVALKRELIAIVGPEGVLTGEVALRAYDCDAYTPEKHY